MDAIETLSADHIRAEIRPVFGDTLAVVRVPDGFVIGSSAMRDRFGDPLELHLVVTSDGMRLEDDGVFLGELAAAGVDLVDGPIGARVDEIVRAAGLHWERATGEIRTDPFAPPALAETARRFADAQRRLHAIL